MKGIPSLPCGGTLGVYTDGGGARGGYAANRGRIATPDGRATMTGRPLGVMVLAILGLLETVGQLGTGLWLLGLLPFVEGGGGRSLGNVLGGALMLLIGAIN